MPRPSLLLLALACACSATARHSSTIARSSEDPPPPAWERLSRGLAGTWTTPTARGGTLEVSYRLVSRGSALVETWGAGTPGETLTVYHPDGDSLLLTHYCAQGNQARLRLVPGGPPTRWCSTSSTRPT